MDDAADDATPRRRRGTRTPEWLDAELRRSVGDARVLQAMADVPRDLFVDPSERARAWDNEALKIGCGQTISQPLVVARMCEVLAPTPEDRVLDIGTGSGYAAAVLARLCRHVWSIERHRELSERAAGNLAAAGVTNVTLVVGDGTLGYQAAAPYDAINVAASAPEIPPALIDQLAAGGRMVIPIYEPAERLILVRRTPEGFERRGLEPVRFVPLVPGD
jgi:protein-L-isoaspartate(D-aspartate) O-methyltransferase